MAKKSPPKPQRVCGDCIHEYACSMWNRGNMHNTDATNCMNYETARMSAAYLIGKLDVLEELKKIQQPECGWYAGSDGVAHCAECTRILNPHIDNFCPGCGRKMNGERKTDEKKD